MKALRRGLMATGLALAAASSVQAAVFTLDFEGINASYPSSGTGIQDFYNGGVSFDGTSGTNYGVAFSYSAAALCLNSTTVTCSDASRGGQGDPASAQNGLYYYVAKDAFIDVAAGFETGFAFNYASVSGGGIVNIYDGLHGSGKLLASLELPANSAGCPDYDAGFCGFTAAGVAFDGVARSVTLGQTFSQITAARFDDLTFGATRPGLGSGVPEPSTWAMMLLGVFGAGAMLRGSRRAEASA